MKLHCCLAALTSLVLAVSTASAQPAAPADELTFSGPYTHQNLTIFLVHGKDQLAGRKFLTLQEALEQKKIVVHETKNVGELAVENVSDDVEVFIQSGDIVKGGQQDRVLGYDLIVSAKSGKVPLASFCVEQGRWSNRGQEDGGKFGSSDNNAYGKALKLAVNGARNQSEVWSKVKDAQMKLGKQVGQSVESKASPTSLQLTLEDKKVLENLEQYNKALAKIADGKKDVIGCVVAINGKVDGADVFASPLLFEKAYGKMLKGCAADALGEFDKDKKHPAVTVEAVKAFLKEANSAKKETNKDVSKRVQVSSKEGEKNLLIETKDRDNGGLIIHRNYIAK
jgi:hypothetical protein